MAEKRLQVSSRLAAAPLMQRTKFLMLASWMAMITDDCCHAMQNRHPLPVGEAFEAGEASQSPAVPSALMLHWERFKNGYMADDDESCRSSQQHLRAVQAIAHCKVRMPKTLICDTHNSLVV